MVDSAIIINDMASYLLKSKTCFGFFFYHEHISVHDIQSCSKLYIYDSEISTYDCIHPVFYYYHVNINILPTRVNVYY